jgi:hypothetical protein
MNDRRVQVLSIRAFALAGGLTLALVVGVLAVLSLVGVGLPLQSVLATVFFGVEPTGAGVFVSFVWGFLIGGLLGALFAWMHNHIVT